MADRCADCGSTRDDAIAFVPWPKALDPERCDRCGAVTSYRWPIESITGKPNALFERRRIAR